MSPLEKSPFKRPVASSAPVFANGAQTAALAYALNQLRSVSSTHGKVDSFGNTRQSDNQVLYTDERGKTMWVDRDMLTEKVLVQNSGRPLSAAEARQSSIDTLDDISTVANVSMIAYPVVAPVAAPIGAAADIGSAMLQNDGEVLLPSLVGQAVEMKLKHFRVPQSVRTRVGAGVEETLNQVTN